MREASPLSLLGTSASHEISALRWTMRCALMPQAWRVGGREAELRERDPHLDRPALRRRRVDRRFPDRVPGVVLEVVVVDDGVALHAGRADLELDAGQVVVVRVEEEREAVGVRDDVAARELADDARRARCRAGARADVERVVVVEEAQLGRLRRRGPFQRAPAGGRTARPAPGSSPPRRGGRRSRSAWRARAAWTTGSPWRRVSGRRGAGGARHTASRQAPTRIRACRAGRPGDCSPGLPAARARTRPLRAPARRRRRRRRTWCGSGIRRRPRRSPRTAGRCGRGRSWAWRGRWPPAGPPTARGRCRRRRRGSARRWCRR